MIDQQFNNVLILMSEIHKFKEDIDKCSNLKSKQILTKRMDELQDEHDRLQKENLKTTNLLIDVNSTDKLNKGFGSTLEERIKAIEKKYPEIEIDLVFKNKL